MCDFDRWYKAFMREPTVLFYSLFAVWILLTGDAIAGLDDETASCGAPIAFSSYRHGETDPNGNGLDDIYIMNEDGSHVTRALDGVEGHKLQSVLPKWAADGRSFVFEAPDTEGSVDFDVFLFSLADKTIRQVTHNPGLASAIPILSPDGGKIAFTARDEVERNSRHIYTININGSDKTQITFHPSGQIFPGWSPDGRKLVYTSTEDGDSEVFIIDLEAGEKVQLSHNEIADNYPHWSQDGAMISFQRGKPGKEDDDIFAINIDGSGERQITTHPAYDSDATLSADNQRILFHSKRSGAQEIYTMNVDRTDLVQLTDTGVRDAHAHWSPVAFCVQDFFEE